MRISAVVMVTTFLLAPSLALAFRAEPSGEVQPPEFGSADLRRVPDAKRQAALTAGKEWQRFLLDHPGPWRVTWDDRAGTPREIAGASIPLVAASAGPAAVESAARNFLRTLAPLSGVSDALLRTSVLRKVGDTWFVRFDRVTARGVAVDGAYAELRLRAGFVTLIRLETHPLADAAPLARLSLAEGKARAHAALGGFLPPSATLSATASAVVVPVAVGAGWEYRPAFKVESSAGRGSRWLSTVDALHGDVLARESLVRWTVEGDVYGSVEPRTVGDAPAAQTLPYLRATVGGAAVGANGSGHWSWGGDAPATVMLGLQSPFVDVRNDSGPEGTATFTAASAAGNDFTFTTANATQSEIAAFRHAETVRQWALAVTPSNPWMQSTLRVNVLLNDQCNAYWDGDSINFFRAGSDCNDTARIADVVYHEYGHGFHQNTTVSGTIDGAVGEGTGDFLAATITDSPLVGPFFFKDGDPVREIETDRVYPGDVVGESHQDGLIWAGSLWDLRKALIAKMGDTAGRAHVDHLFATALAAGPRLDQAYAEILLADDDDADPGNGTPNQCEIESAFGAHGLSGSSALFAGLHPEITGTVDGLQAIPVVAVPPASIGACGAAVVSIDVTYRIDNASPETIALAPGATDYTGAIPAPGNGHLVRYWLEVELSSGTTVTLPAGAPEYRYAFWTGETFSVFREDFESGENGWTHGGVRDDWEIGVPEGNAGDPEAAFSGTSVLGNDVDGDGSYPSDAASWAESPVIDCRGCTHARLRLRRWLTVEDGNWDQASLLVDGQPVWTNPVAGSWNGPPVRDPHWSFEDFDIGDIADGKRFSVRFELTTDQGLELGGWNVDDVEVVSLAEPTTGNGGHGGGSPWSCDVGTTASTLPGMSTALAALAIAWRRRSR